MIDDDLAALNLLSRWLERCGYRVITAESGESGLELARALRPEIVLLDALMPGLSGYDVLPTMRADPDLAGTPIILVTVDDNRMRGINAGASDFVRKPVSEAQLRDLLAVYDQATTGDILIIDDDDDAAEIMSRNLRRLGFTTHRAQEGADGLNQVRRVRPKAIVLDLNMPNMNGFQFLEELAANALFKDIPILIVSGHDLSLRDHQMLSASGCRVFLKGSSAPREIAQSLREMVS